MVMMHPLVLSLCLAAGGDTVLLDFSSERCGPCRLMQPIVRRLADEGYPIHEIDVDRDRQTAARFGVTGVPCFVMLRDGHEVDRVVGAASHSRLLQMFATAEHPAPGANDPRSITSTNNGARGIPNAVAAGGPSLADDRIASILRPRPQTFARPSLRSIACRPAAIRKRSGNAHSRRPFD